MRELTIGEQTIRVRATPLALLYYKQEFGTDLLGDLIVTMKNLTGLHALSKNNADLSNVDFSKFDSTTLLKLIWAMAKADAYSFKKEFPSFMEWVATLDSFDISDQNTIIVALEEAANGFFRSGIKTFRERTQHKG